MNAHWKSCNTFDQLARDLANNASAGEPEAMLLDIRDVIARVIELVTTSRPMETAPNDGTDVLLFAPTEEPAFVVGYWADWGGWDYREELVREVATGHLDPQGWLPLPQPRVLSLEEANP